VASKAAAVKCRSIRAAHADRNRDKEHVGRSYDHPHVIVLDFHMCQIAKLDHGMSKYPDATGSLQRSRETARALRPPWVAGGVDNGWTSRKSRSSSRRIGSTCRPEVPRTRSTSLTGRPGGMVLKT